MYKPSVIECAKVTCCILIGFHERGHGRRYDSCGLGRYLNFEAYTYVCIALVVILTDRDWRTVRRPLNAIHHFGKTVIFREEVPDPWVLEIVFSYVLGK